MRNIEPPLINHAPRTAPDGTSAPSADQGCGAATIRSDREVVDVARDGQHGLLTVPVSGTFRLPVSTGRIDWMRPADPPFAAVTTPVESTLVTSEQTLAHSGVQMDESEEGDCLTRFAKVLHRRHGIPNDAALAIALASLSAAVGPVRTLKNPLGGSVSSALNVIVEDDTSAAVRRAAQQALLPFQQQVAKKMAGHQEKGPKHLRQLRMEMEQECAQAVRWLHSPPEMPREPLTIPIPPGEQKREAMPTAIEEVERVADRMKLLEFEERPFVMVDGLSVRDIPTLSQRSFDGAILNFSPGGDVLQQLETSRPVERREVLRYLVAAWHGRPFVAGVQSIINPLVANLWLLKTGDTIRAWRNPAIAASGLTETFLLVANEDAVEVDIASFTDTEADDNWNAFINVVLGERIMGEMHEHHLSAPAVQRFLQFHAQTVRQTTADAGKFVAWWPEHLLKFALLLHVDSWNKEVSPEIGLATLEDAINVMERLGAAQLRVIEAVTSRPKDFDAEIEVMVAKIRLSGPMPKWSLFKRYHVHRVEVMEPILARCCERNLLRVEDDLVQLTDATK